MKISSRFTVAVHILALIKIEREYTLTSTQIADSVNTNPVVIRRLMGRLKEAGFIDVSRGNSGAKLLKPLDEITLFDVYKAVEVVEKDIYSKYMKIRISIVQLVPIFKVCWKLF